MPTALATSTRTVALIGNPNTGKSTLFGSLVGVHQRVGNYPGVTVEKKTGRMEHAGCRFELIDLPGLYSLAARARDEMVAVDVLLKRQAGVAPVDVVICIVDASNMERHLYLTSQVLELGLPVVVAVNMLDVAASRGVHLDLQLLEKRLGVPVVGTQANRGKGIAELKAALTTAGNQGAWLGKSLFPEAFESEVSQLEEFLNSARAELFRDGQYSDEAKADDHGWLGGSIASIPSRSLARRILLDASGYIQGVLFARGALHADGNLARHLDAARARLASEGCPVPAIETTVRYKWTQAILDGVVSQPRQNRVTDSDRIDRVLTHRIAGPIIFALIMFIMFQAVFAWAKPLMTAIGNGFGALGHLVEGAMAEGALRSLLVDGVIGGVGSVITFLPQIMILFLFIAVLEDCGYMARAAYLMDRTMSRVGLSGRSFIPMLSSFACAIPGIMSARVIENERDRLTTILVAPLMTCSARLPVYALLIAAFIPATTYVPHLVGLQGLVLGALYLLGIVTAVVVALVLKKTILRGKTPPFLMELPSYKWPSLKIVFLRVTQRASIFIRTAGSLILAVSVLIWAANYYPHNQSLVAPLDQQRENLEAQRGALTENDPRRAALGEQITQTEYEIDATYQKNSILGWLGHGIEPVVKPLGWDWRIGCAVIASFPAREVVVATLGVIYGLGKDVDADSEEGFGPLQARLKEAKWDGTDRLVYTTPVALSLMVFFALCAQCAATLAVIRRETNSWRWPAFTFAYMTTLAYLAALVTYQVGTWLST